MAGLLAARVLSDFYESVTVVERDVLPEQAHQRRGVSQGHHLHALLSRGSRAIGQLFPGLFDVAARKLRPLWQGNRLTDFTVLPTDDWRRVPKRLLNWGMTKLFAAAATDIALTWTFLRTLNLVDRPTALVRPSQLRRVIVGNLRFNPK